MLINVLLYTFGYFKYNQKGIRITQNEKKKIIKMDIKNLLFLRYMTFVLNLMFSVDN